MSPTGSSSAQGTATDKPCGPETDSAEVGIKPNWDNRERNGICLVLPGAKQDTDILIDTVGTMNVKCTRLWMHATALLDDPTTPNAATERNRVYYGMMYAFYNGNGKVIKTCIGAKEKGKTLYRLYGGDTEKLDRYLGGHKVYGGNT